MRSLFVVALLSFAAARAEAQTPSRSTGTFVDVSFAPHRDETRSRSSRVAGTQPSVGLAAGFDNGVAGVEIDVNVPQWHTKTVPPQRYLYAGQTFGWQQQGHTYEWSGTVRRRSIDVMLFYRRNVRITERIGLTWLAGGGRVLRPQKVTTVTNEVLPGGRLTLADVRDEASSNGYAAAAARLDLAVAITPALSVVPRLRATIYPSWLDDSGSAPRVLMLRPEIAVRWRF